MSILAAVLGFVRAILRRRATLALENLALRQQLAVLRRSVKRPRLLRRGRVFWVLPGCSAQVRLTQARTGFSRRRAQRTHGRKPQPLSQEAHQTASTRTARHPPARASWLTPGKQVQMGAVVRKSGGLRSGVQAWSDGICG